MPGVTVIQTSGAPGAQTGSITIRGKNSINAASPLVIVDGIPGSMNNIDPQDIESISVLKDAASSAIYGVQAANGVILITTKKGKKGQKARVNYSGTVTWASPTAKLKFLGAADYATLFNEATLNEDPNAPLPYTAEDIELYRNGKDPIGHPNTDWYNEVFKKHAIEPNTVCLFPVVQKIRHTWHRWLTCTRTVCHRRNNTNVTTDVSTLTLR